MEKATTAPAAVCFPMVSHFQKNQIFVFFAPPGCLTTPWLSVGT